MQRSPSFLLLAAAAASVASCTAAPPPGAARPLASTRQCFLPGQVNGFQPGRYGFVDVAVGTNRYYRLELGGGCPDINWSLRVGLRPLPGSGSFSCEGYDAELIVPDPSGLQRCPISSITPITREQYNAKHR